MPLSLFQLYQKLEDRLGPTGWWPADSKAEIIVCAICIQNTAWQNADRAVANFRQATNFDPKKILSLTDSRLEDLMRPGGFFHNKSKSIRAVFSWLDQWDQDYERVSQHFGPDLRKQLLKLRGLGPETTDVLRLFVFDQSCFVADKYARTLFKNLGAGKFANYQSLYQHCQLSDDFKLADAQEFHALIDEFGKQSLSRTSHFSDSFLAGDRLQLG